MFSKAFCCYDFQSNKFKFSSQGLNKGTPDDCENDLISKYCKVFEKSINVASIKRGFRTILHAVVIYEQAKKIISYVFIKRKVQLYGRHTQLLSL